ncbi:ATP-binding protein [Candidatus Margulisiibacteriota bacterium]
MKKFIFGKLVDEENICNLEKEKELISKHINAGNNVVIYGPRNSGKTSLVKNIIIRDFKLKHPKNFVYFVDLFNANDSSSMNFRLKAALEHSLAQIPLKKWTNDIQGFISGLRPEFSLDPVTGSANISLKSIDYKDSQSIYEIFNILSKIAATRKLLLVFDEFQDIAGLKAEQGIIRGILQEINASVVIMGSKSHLLKEIFSSPREPFYQWGVSIEFKPIDYKVYHDYIQERFAEKQLFIKYQEAEKLQDDMHRVPEAINIVCNELMENYRNITIEHEHISQVILSLLETKQGQYEELLRCFSLNEQIVLVSIAKKGTIKQYNAKEYIAELRMNNKTVANIFRKMLDEGHLDYYEDHYRLNDPLLEIFLKLYR